MNTAMHQFTQVFEAGAPSLQPAPNVPLVQRFETARELAEFDEQLQRGAVSDPDATLARLLGTLNRGVTSGMTAFPVRENLEAEALALTPVETPLRNMLPRVPGAGTAVKWKVQTSFGTGLGTATTTSGTTNTANTLTVVNARGFFVGESFLYTGTTFVITAINYSTNVISVASGIGADSQTNGQTVVKVSLFWPESGAPTRMFYSETGAPVESTTVYADRTASYKLLGDMGSVTLFAAASGANFMNQIAVEKANCLIRTMLKEEYALLHGDSAATNAPWGDGSTALAYQGLIPYVTANSPAAQIQSSVGALTLEHVHSQLSRIWYQGGRGMYVILNGREAESLTKIATTTGNYRVILTNERGIQLGGKVASIVHAVSGEEVPIYVHPFMPVGRIVFGAERNQRGQASAEVDVLPQVQGPETAFGTSIQGYFAQEIAPTAAAPEVMLFKVGLYSVPKWKNPLVFGLSTGVTAA
jgi:hypothetical protein